MESARHHAALPMRQVLAVVVGNGLEFYDFLAISVFGGSTQFLVAWLIRATGNPLIPAWYMFCGVTIGLIALFQLPETAPIKTTLNPA